MTEASLTYRWSREGFVRAWEAGAFDARVEYVEGEVVPVVIGDWHGLVTASIVARLRHPTVTVTQSTLPAAGSLPDPDCWVRRRGAEPVGRVAPRLPEWNPDDVLLVVEISDETVTFDLTTKARLYGSAGCATYWVVTRQAVYVHTEPTPDGYRHRTELRPGDLVRAPYLDADLPVEALIAVES
jgi:hypothetical protein